jgi:hypothetical protein
LAWSFDTREEAVKRVENVISRHSTSGYNPEDSFWWGVARDGERLRFVIEDI